MSTSRPRLADTMREKKKAPHSPAVPVADTFANQTANLTRRTTIYLSDGTWKKLKHCSVEEGRNLSQILEALAADYLKDK